MTDNQALAEIALAQWRPDIRPNVLADLARQDPAGSVYGWHRHLPGDLLAVWNSLTMGERLVAYLMAAELASREG